ncbi:segregation/condensation protein A [Aneurinibacillus sp. Ricciae_BoGa-3]|uniref:segregation and condensation protein A n=1 Tax=Aneurinibacillus sp. Ricciae_BoGa-3 TaxID=3022697 RepID=UPI00233FA382|nr:segregation/condensation protein A [Aneurinibacillus sp. Ricciae_BoGa-3]WCK56014.1 segregation/condensation protein A [Aneurinibacillus sp. Ricciae_BoGa-3]
MALDVKLDMFEGPLDLLLHLIDRAEVDIYDIPIAEITEQYMGQIYIMQELQLDIASEFLVMAATLLAIKSKLLLPQRSVESFDDYAFEYEEEPEDPRQELVQRLLEYRKYKELASELRGKESEQSRIFTRPAEDLTRFLPPEEENPVANVTLYDLVEALQKTLKRALNTERKPVRVQRDEISIKDKMFDVEKRLKDHGGTLYFTALMETEITKTEIVTTFLAILELMKKRTIYCQQNGLFDEIVVSLQGD